MNTTLLWAVTLAYAGQAGIAAYGKNYAGAVILIGYVIANIGLIVSFRG